MSELHLPRNEALHHTKKVKGMFDDSHARAMFETSAEVISRLKKTFEHYELGSEKS